MTTNENTNLDIKFDITLESIELDLKGWLKTLFRQNFIRPIIGTDSTATTPASSPSR